MYVTGKNSRTLAFSIAKGGKKKKKKKRGPQIGTVLVEQFGSFSLDEKAAQPRFSDPSWPVLAANVPRARVRVRLVYVSESHPTPNEETAFASNEKTPGIPRFPNRRILRVAY